MKKKITVGTTLFLGCLFVSGCTAKEVAVKSEPLLDKEYFKTAVRVEEDPTGKAVRLSTVDGLTNVKSSNVGSSDNYLNAVIEKETGRVTYEVYNSVVYDTIEGRFHKEVRYAHPKGRETKKLTVIDRKIKCADNHSTQCAFVEEVKFGVDEELVKEIANRYRPGSASAWKYTLKSPSDEDYRAGFFPAEVAGLIERVEEYRSRIQ